MLTCLATLANLERVGIPSGIGIAGAVARPAARQTAMVYPRSRSQSVIDYLQLLHSKSGIMSGDVKSLRASALMYSVRTN
jgi:hypothetical protein